jgi:hypothetical protein
MVHGLTKKKYLVALKSMWELVSTMKMTSAMLCIPVMFVAMLICQPHVIGIKTLIFSMIMELLAISMVVAHDND